MEHDVCLLACLCNMFLLLQFACPCWAILVTIKLQHPLWGTPHGRDFPRCAWNNACWGCTSPRPHVHSDDSVQTRLCTPQHTGTSREFTNMNLHRYTWNRWPCPHQNFPCDRCEAPGEHVLPSDRSSRAIRYCIATFSLHILMYQGLLRVHAGHGKGHDW